MVYGCQFLGRPFEIEIAIYRFQPRFGVLQYIFREAIAIEVGSEDASCPIIQIDLFSGPGESIERHTMIYRVEESHDVAFSHI